MAVRVLVAVTAMVVVVGGCSVAVSGQARPGAAPVADQPTSMKPLPRPSQKDTPSRDQPSEPAPSASAPSEAEEAVLTVAQTYVDAMNRQDDAAVTAITCSHGAPSLHQIAHPTATFAVEPPVEWNENTGNGRVPLLIDGKPDTPLVIRREGESLCAWG